jgi:hypothetical protein
MKISVIAVLIVCVNSFPSIGWKNLDFGKSADGRIVIPHDDIVNCVGNWIPAKPDDHRGPCPALNTLANHGFLPRSGKYISKDILSKALLSVFNLSTDLTSALFVDAYNHTVLHSAENTTQYIDLKELSKHNGVEHDASLTRYDYGDAGNENFTPQPALINQLKSFAADGALDLTSSTKARILRIKQEKASDPTYSLESRFDDDGLIDSVLIFRLLGTGKTLPVEWVDTWFLNERIPKGWQVPSSVYDFAKFGADMDIVRACNKLLLSGSDQKCRDN